LRRPDRRLRRADRRAVLGFHGVRFLLKFAKPSEHRHELREVHGYLLRWGLAIAAGLCATAQSREFFRERAERVVRSPRLLVLGAVRGRLHELHELRIGGTPPTIEL